MAILGPTAQSCGRAPRVNLKTVPMAIALVLSQLGQGPAKADAPLLPIVATTTTVPANGDLNPYGVAFVPSTFSGGGTGPLLLGDILVSNFNASRNLQGTGTTVIRYRPSDAVAGPGAAEVFFQEPTGQPPG
jgi:hypothetical protein